MSAESPRKLEDQKPYKKYESKAKYETVEEIKEEDKTKLNRAYNIWVLMKQNKQDGTEGTLQQSYENVLKQASHFGTVPFY